MMNTPYGSYSMFIDGNTIVTRFAGMFNVATTELFVQEAKPLIEQFGDKQFLVLADMLNLEGATPEAYTVIDSFNRWINTRNMLAKALIIENKIIAQIARLRVESTKYQNIQYFKTKEDALSWFSEFQQKQIAS
ncbi:hypothetical protein Q4574_10530 [Aliiglaciecola sp. 3_MG-2023]|uniref:hypothetical protein n=1 Tax=Aliiglaciecola sp. 3_MG-2023 TaxID=3062644 RepID=UPI0026E2ABE0|nr:hypothetical protein [Aliiglaciecola sp. 3_MG-2023]MDO6693723.1 hypothetical protein [Aliiglaciecola sp. 3_MG-2023]